MNRVYCGIAGTAVLLASSNPWISRINPFFLLLGLFMASILIAIPVVHVLFNPLSRWFEKIFNSRQKTPIIDDPCNRCDLMSPEMRIRLHTLNEQSDRANEEIQSRLPQIRKQA